MAHGPGADRDRLRRLAGWGLAAVALLVVMPGQGEERRDSSWFGSWKARQEPLHEYRGWRRMHAKSKRLNQEAWVDAWTELDASGFRYRVVSERGSESIRKRVLLSMLRREEELAAGGSSRAALSDDNYRFVESRSEAGEVVYIQMTPRRKDVTLVDGWMALSRLTGDLLRIEGRLAKNPSFWTSAVHVVRHFAAINGVQMPIALEAVAKVKIAGDSTMDVVYEYESVNGRPVSSAVRRHIAARMEAADVLR